MKIPELTEEQKQRNKLFHEKCLEVLKGRFIREVRVTDKVYYKEFHGRLEVYEEGKEVEIAEDETYISLLKYKLYCLEEDGKWPTEEELNDYAMELIFDYS